jgi:hypothetical protein
MGMDEPRRHTVPLGAVKHGGHTNPGPGGSSLAADLAAASEVLARRHRNPVATLGGTRPAVRSELVQCVTRRAEDWEIPDRDIAWAVGGASVIRKHASEFDALWLLAPAMIVGGLSSGRFGGAGFALDSVTAMRPINRQNLPDGKLATLPNGRLAVSRLAVVAITIDARPVVAAARLVRAGESVLRVAALLADELAAIQCWHGLEPLPMITPPLPQPQPHGVRHDDLVFPEDATSRGQRPHVDGVVCDDSVARATGWRQRPELLAPLHGPVLRERLRDVSVEVRELATGSQVRIGMGRGDRGTIYKVNRRPDHRAALEAFVVAAVKRQLFADPMRLAVETFEQGGALACSQSSPAAIDVMLAIDALALSEIAAPRT